MNISAPHIAASHIEPCFWAALRSFDRPGWQPALLAMLVFTAIVSGMVIHISLMGELQTLLSRDQSALSFQGDFIIACILAAGLCYLIAVLVYQHRLYTQVLQDLRPAMDLSDDDYAALVRRSASPDQISMTIGALMGVGASYIWLLFDPRVYEGTYNPYDFASLSTVGPWQRVIGGLMGGAIGAFMNSTVHSAIFLSRLGSRLKPLDLFNLTPLRPFARQGTANLLWLTGFTTIFASSYFLDPEIFLGMIIAFVVMNAILSIGGLLLPVAGMARRIQQRKESELEGVQQALQELGPARDMAQSGHLSKSAQLLAYRSFVQSVPIFPYSLNTVVRMGLFLLIPLWSWAAASFVERGLGTFFGWD